MRAQRGFTFIELMMTLAILGVMLLGAVPLAQVAVQRQKEHELRVALIQIREALDAYKRASEQGRILQKLGDSGYPTSLRELADGVTDQRSPSKQMLFFLRRLPRDPFYPDTTRPPEQTWGLRSYASSADAPVAGRDIFDVYSTSDKVGLNGVPYRQW